ncbi:winged helix-turn-helix transcriptional regulator [Paenibacillus pasadenensis]|nr:MULTISPECIES: winged helix-turn-helix transcriptional regulator [Paenibacillus]QGG57850.1 MarR family transcriptional regulator [Paenibacillus sp. B01]
MSRLDMELCPRFEKAVDLLSKRWTTLIVYKLLAGPQRFARIEDSLPGLSGKMLAERLKELEAEGVVLRTVYPEMPVRIEYSLTDKGRALEPIVSEIARWSQDWLPASSPDPAES